MKIVIRAGGVGSRLWPLSRARAPKQFHSFVGENTMIQDAVERVASIVSLQDIFVSTNASSFDLVRKQLPNLPVEHCIIEPARRDTAAAVGLEAVYIAREDPQAVIASLGSDHLITKPEEFCRLLKVSEAFLQAHPTYLTTLGVKPQYIETGYGHIKMGDVLGKFQNEPVYKVDAFMEKPKYDLAKEYTESGQYLWNSNMFAWRADTILSLFREHVPKMYEGLMRIQEAIGTSRERVILEEIYTTLEKISIDYAIIEKIEDMAVVAADIGWTDIGSWKTLGEVQPLDAQGNLLRAPAELIDTQQSIVYGRPGKIIATIGLDNVVIVDTEDALLVCDKNRTQDVKKIVETLEKKKKEQYL